MSTPFDATPASTVVPATDGQVKYIASLLDERDLSLAADTQPKFVARATALRLVIAWAYAPMADDTPPAVSRAINDTVGRLSSYGERVNAVLAHIDANSEVAPSSNYVPLTKAGASKLIEWLSTQPRTDRVQLVKDATAVVVSEVPAGRYAVETNDGAINELAFYRVDRPETGKWAGYVFVKHIVSDEEHRMSRAAGEAVLAKIASVGAEDAAARYGLELGECGMCGRTLTNDESRARGIGPKCASKAGW